MNAQIIEPSQLFKAIMPDEAIQPDEIITSGGVNAIFVFSESNQKKVLRVRTGEAHFVYEKGFFKELLAAHFLASAKHGIESLNDNQAILEQSLADAKNGVIPNKKSELLPSPRKLGKISFQGKDLIWMVQDYADGDLIAYSHDRDTWKNIGRKVALLHRFKLASAGRFDADTRDLSFESHILAVLGEIKVRSPVQLNRKFSIDTNDHTGFSLCHNDLHCLNVKGDMLIDWDNCSISMPEQDFAKLRQWGTIDTDGYLSHDAQNYDAFVEGYRGVSHDALNAELLDLYELLFLCRAYSFEKTREDNGREPSPPLPPSFAYIDRIKELSLA